MKDDKTAIVAKFPPCDFCHNEKGVKTPAAFDAKTLPNSPGRGQWAFMCLVHFNKHTSGKLGLGLGQRLLVEMKDEELDEQGNALGNKYNRL